MLSEVSDFWKILLFKAKSAKQLKKNIYIYICVHANSLQSCGTLWTAAQQTPLVHEILQAFPSPGDLPDPGIEYNTIIHTHTHTFV